MSSKNLIFLLLVFIFSAAHAGPMQDITNRVELENYLTESEFSGVIGVSKNSQIIYRKSFGERNLVNRAPILVTDKFQIGSVTKQFVSVALLKLQQENKLSLNDKLSKYIPQFPRSREVEIIDLLQHVAGPKNYTDQNTFWDLVSDGRTLSLEDIINYSTQFPYDFDPKTKWKYSNTGYILAGRIIEIVTGQSWDDYIRTELLEPMKLQNTGYVAQFERVSEVIGHVDSNGVLTAVPHFNLSWALSAGALYSDISDLLKWTQIYSDSPLLTAESKKALISPHLQNYALGVMVTPYSGDTKITHSGRTPGFSTTLSYLLKTKLAVAKLDNNDGSRVDAEAVTLKFFATSKAQALKLKPYILREDLNDFVGVYSGSKMNFNVFIKDAQLFLQPNDGQPAYKLIPNDKDSFRIMTLAGEEFVRSTDGKVVALRHYQGGQVSQFTKISAP